MNDRDKHGKTQKGESHAMAKLTQSEVDEIRAEHAAGSSVNEIRHRRGIRHSTVWLILNGKTWKG